MENKEEDLFVRDYTTNMISISGSNIPTATLTRSISIDRSIYSEDNESSVSPDELILMFNYLKENDKEFVKYLKMDKIKKKLRE